MRAALRARLAAERGNAVVEFVVLAVALLIPCVYLVLSLGALQNASFAADAIARDAARIHATAPDPAAAEARLSSQIALMRDDYRLTGEETVSISCTATPCGAPGGVVTAHVRIAVPVPGLGGVLGREGPFAVGATRAVAVGEHRGANR